MKCEAIQVKREFCLVDKFEVIPYGDPKLVHYKSHINFNFGGSGHPLNVNAPLDKTLPLANQIHVNRVWCKWTSQSEPGTSREG